MELVGKLRFHNEYGELENTNPGDRAEESEGAVLGVAVVASGVGVVSIFPSWTYSSCSLKKMACCAVFALMAEYGHQGQWCRWRRRWQWGQDWHRENCGVWVDSFFRETSRSVVFL